MKSKFCIWGGRKRNKLQAGLPFDGAVGLLCASPLFSFLFYSILITALLRASPLLPCPSPLIPWLASFSLLSHALLFSPLLLSSLLLFSSLFFAPLFYAFLFASFLFFSFLFFSSTLLLLFFYSPLLPSSPLRPSLLLPPSLLSPFQPRFTRPCLAALLYGNDPTFWLAIRLGEYNLAMCPS